jgi:hypothetical protein
MNDILRWAKEADLWMTSDERIAAVERFAALVRADEREQCAKVCDELHRNPSAEPDECAAAIRARSEA